MCEGLKSSLETEKPEQPQEAKQPSPWARELWERAGHAVEREEGIPCGKDAHKVGGLSQRFVTRIVTTIGEQSYLWEARKARRNRLQRSEVDKRPHLHPFALFDRKRIRTAIASPVRRISFAVGPVFFFGAILFVVGTAGQVQPGYWKDEWTMWQSLGIVDIPFLVGAVIFLVGCYLAFLEAANIDYSEDYQLWEKRGEPGAKPKLSTPLWPQHLKSRWISYYGVGIQYLGSIVFVVGCATEVAETVQPDLSKDIVRWLLDFPFLVGGLCFFLGAYLLATEGTHSWWRGTLPPLRKADLSSTDYWVQYLNLVGSFCFFFGGVYGWFSDRLSTNYNILFTAFSWLLGSVLFVLQGALMYLEIINPIW